MARRVKIMEKSIDLANVRDIFFSNEFKKTVAKPAKEAMEHKVLVAKIKASYGITEDNNYDASLANPDANFIYGEADPEFAIMTAAMTRIKDVNASDEERKQAFYSMLDVYKLKMIDVQVAQKTLNVEYKEYKNERPRTAEGWGERQKVYKREKYVFTEEHYKAADKIMRKFHGAAE